MTKLKKLQKQALESCVWRGHKMVKWLAYDDNSATTHCEICKAYVVVKTNPMPNEIDIGGTAVALNCK